MRRSGIDGYVQGQMIPKGESDTGNALVEHPSLHSLGIKGL
jgi:hypothetical protein